MMRIKKLSLIAFTLFGLCPVLLAQNVIDIAGKHLEELAIKNQFAPEDVLSPRISDYYTSGGIIHLYFQQTVDEIGIYGTSAAVHLKEDEIISRVLDRIVGGETAQPHSFPWMVSLRDPAAPKGEEKNDCK